MAHFSYQNEINSFLTMDGELARGPAPRWQKKIDLSTSSINSSVLSTSINKQKLSISYNNAAASFIANNNKTPRKNSSDGKSKKSPGRKTPTPNKNSKTPSGGDRFIPSRNTTNFELGHYMIKQTESQTTNNEEKNSTESSGQNDIQKLLTETMQGCEISNKRILSYQTKAPAAPESHLNPLRVVYSIKTPMSLKSGSRYIPVAPERILDAPDIINDYYLNLMDWSSENIITVALGSSVYLWNAATGIIDVLFENENGEHSCSLAWIQEGSILAVGTNSGTVELWDCQQMKRLRVMDGQTTRVSALAWNSYIVSSGSRDGSIVHHDVRSRDHNVATLSGHTQEICGLKWSTDAKYLASGGNDNLVNIWSTTSGALHTNSTPFCTFNQHQAAVRALAWCPWQSNVLASGGGTADRCIRFWNVSNQQLLNTVDTKSQVCGILFSKNYKELISCHGFANNQLTIWKYPSMTKQIDLTGHTARVLQMAMSPDGSTVMSAGADETLRLWNCFAPDPTQSKKEKSATRSKPSVFKQSIR
uniref:Putative anaphase promoting complex cdc20 cdh1 and ama1 subunit n=1 Tax=Corethrella appendiculata TaxID=1370023 RepID=U5EZT8_9DIPT